MEFLSVIAAAAASYAFGAVWYMTLSKPWIAASGVVCDENGRPKNTSKTPFIISAIVMLSVAGFMRHLFTHMGVDTAGHGLMAGAGIGLFFIAPWVALNYAYSDRPRALTFIDGGYALIGPALIGLVLGAI